MVLFSLDVLQIGRSSVTVRISGAAGDQARMRATLTLVWIDGMKAAAWPAQMRARLEAHLEGGA